MIVIDTTTLLHYLFVSFSLLASIWQFYFLSSRHAAIPYRVLLQYCVEFDMRPFGLPVR